jgi:hypothetical protein
MKRNIEIGIMIMVLLSITIASAMYNKQDVGQETIKNTGTSNHYKIDVSATSDQLYVRTCCIDEETSGWGFGIPVTVEIFDNNLKPIKDVNLDITFRAYKDNINWNETAFHIKKKTDANGKAMFGIKYPISGANSLEIYVSKGKLYTTYYKFFYVAFD